MGWNLGQINGSNNNKPRQIEYKTKSIIKMYLLETFLRKILDIVVDELERIQLEALKRLVVDALQIISRHFYIFYGVLKNFCK